MSDRRVLGFAWLTLTLILWLVLQDLFQWGFATFDVANARLGGQVDMSALVAMVVASVVAVAMWKHETVFSFGIETVEETRKVVWPTKEETKDNTVIVVITAAIMAVLLGVFDLVWAKLTNIILGFGSGV